MSSELSSAASILRELIQCPSVTPLEGGALTVLQTRLESLGFTIIRKTATAPNTPDVENLYARLGNEGPNLCFAGHTDVVPEGDPELWKSAPFEGAVIDGNMIGRGAVDMKGGIACFIAAVEQLIADGQSIPGSISLLITGDEEGPAINGTAAILDHLSEEGEKIDACIVGEPTNPNVVGDAIKIGRRGSVSGTITVHGKQGHSAYPHLADNPSRNMTTLLASLMETTFDEGTENFQATNLEVTSIDIGNPAFNVIPHQAQARFNVRFNDTWTADSIKSEIESRLTNAATDNRFRTELEGKPRPAIKFDISYTERPSHVFLTRDDRLISALANAVEDITGQRPELSTGGGTSDARFIKDVCPVVEFGLVGQTMHQIDEHVPLADLDQLTAIYHAFIGRYFQTCDG